MNTFRIAVIASALALSFTTAQACDYNAAGSPDLSHFTRGHTSFDQVQSTLGNPVQMTADASGNPSSASFYIPLKGDRPIGAATGAENMASGSAVATVSSHAGSLLSHIPGIGGLIGAGAAQIGTQQAAAAVTGAGARVWVCSVSFANGGMYQSGSCTTINRPVGA